MIYHNAVKRILSAPEGCDRRAADRYSLLFRALGVAAKSFPIIKIHGESGKSACAVMLSHALTACGYRTGTVTTPFSHAMTECIATDGKPISMDASRSSNPASTKAFCTRSRSYSMLPATFAPKD